MYTVDYFIEKFEAIPGENWTIDDTGVKADNPLLQQDLAKRCALGHCGGYEAKESIALVRIFYDHFCQLEVLTYDADPEDISLVYTINDLRVGSLEQSYTRGFKKSPFVTPPREDTPKERILSILYDIRNGNNAMKQVSEILEEEQHQIA